MAEPLMHFLSSGRVLPPCSRNGQVTPAFWEVTCPDCLVSLPFALAQFRQAYIQLANALLNSVGIRRPVKWQRSTSHR